MSDLLRRVSQGDRAAWAGMYDMFRREVMAVCLAVLRNEDDALDAAEETFLKAFTRASDINPNGNVRAWLITIAANTCRDRLRKEQNRLRWLRRWRVVQAIRQRRYAVEAQVRHELRQESVQQALALLPERYRQPLVLRFYADMDYAEIARILSELEGTAVTETTVGTRIHRAKQQLRQLITRQEVSPHGTA